MQIIIVLKGKDLLSVESLEIVKRNFANVGIPFSYDSFKINFGSPKSLTNKGDKYLFEWINKDKTEDIEIYDSSNPTISISLSKDRTVFKDQSLQQAVNERLSKNIHTSTMHTFSPKIISLCTTLCNELIICYGVASIGYPQHNQYNFIFPIEEMAYTDNNLGWINIFGKIYKDLTDFLVMLKIRPTDKHVSKNIYKVKFDKTKAQYLDDNYEALDLYVSENVNTSLFESKEGVFELENKLQISLVKLICQ